VGELEVPGVGVPREYGAGERRGGAVLGMNESLGYAEVENFVAEFAGEGGECCWRESCLGCGRHLRVVIVSHVMLNVIHEGREKLMKRTERKSPIIVLKVLALRVCKVGSNAARGKMQASKAGLVAAYDSRHVTCFGDRSQGSHLFLYLLVLLLEVSILRNSSLYTFFRGI
jgi:hypothetical protein